MKRPSPRRKFGFTLVELVIAITLLTILLTSGVVVINHVSRLRQQVEMKEYLYTEMQAVMERMARTVQSSGIDYEEYYNISSAGGNYGDNYDRYHYEFFDSGYEKFQNPATGDEEDANAMCDGGSSCSDTIDYHQVNELYLIDKSGTIRTYFALESDGDGSNGQIAMVKLTGSDTSDGDSLVDYWECADGYTCSGDTPEPTDLLDGVDNDDFVPISPSNITIDSLYFYISPIEDPYKGILETDVAYESVQIHPKVTIVMSGYYEGSIHLLDAPSLTLQTTVSTGIYSKHDTYSP